MGTLFKFLVLAFALVGLCFLITTYMPGAWKTGYVIPMTKHHLSWAATTLGVFAGLGYLKVTVK